MYSFVLPVDMFFQVGNSIQVNYTSPFFMIEDYNRDGLTDFIVKNGNKIIVCFQTEAEEFNNSSCLSVDLPANDDIQNFSFDLGMNFRKYQEFHFLLFISDLNNDGLLDLITEKIQLEKGIFNIKTELQFYYGKESEKGFGSIYSKTPDQVIRNKSSVQVGTLLYDINGDGSKDLLIPNVKFNLISLANIFLSQKASIDFKIYFMGKDNRYPEEPIDHRQLVLDFSFSDDNFVPLYNLNDYNGDGVIDLLTTTNRKELSIFTGNKTPPLLDKKQDISYQIFLLTE